MSKPIKTDEVSVQATEEKPERKVRESIILVGEVDFWTEEFELSLQTQLKDVSTLRCGRPEQLDTLLENSDLAAILVQARTEAELGRCFAVSSVAREWIWQGLATVIVVTPLLNHPQIRMMERRGIIQVLGMKALLKTVRIKLEFSFSKMRSRVKSLMQKDKDYLVRFKGAAEERSESVVSADWSAFEPRTLEAGFDNDRDTRVQSEFRQEDPAAEIAAGSAHSQEPESLESGRGLAMLEDHARTLVLISERSMDLKFVVNLSGTLGLNFHVFQHVNRELLAFLGRYPNSIVFWDVDHEKAAEARHSSSLENVGLMLSKIDRPFNVFALSNQPVSRISYVENFGRHVFTHNLVRKQNPVALDVYSRLVRAIGTGNTLGLERYFDPGSRCQRIEIRQSSHRMAAIGATERFLVKQGLSSRLATQVSLAVDELLLNALFRAPVDDAGNHYRTQMDQKSEFSLSEKEEVSLSVMSNEKYFGVCVSDRFGSLKLDSVIPSLREDHRMDTYCPEEGAPKEGGEGLGLYKVIQSGFSLLLVSAPGQMTEVTLFFPNTKHYREFKNLFNFLSGTWSQGR